MKKFLFLALFFCSIVSFAGNRCPQYNIGDALPSYVEKNGYMVPASPANFAALGILVRVDAIPEAGKIIVKSHGEVINGQWVEVIDEQKTQEEIKNAQSLLKSKFTKLQIRRALRSLGQEAALDILLADETFKKDWSDAIEIDLNDTMTKQALTSLNVDINAVKIAISNLE
ncbi:MAG: hypothetical protein ACYC4Q_10405 [Victivallaceae bacterium]